MALGADGVYVGTRFIATPESPAHENFKHAILIGRDGDTIAIRHSGAGGVRDGSAGFTDERRGSVRIMLNHQLRDVLNRHNGMVDYDTLAKYSKPVHEYLGSSRTAASLIYGDSEVGFFFAGQGVGLIHEILSCKEVIRKIMAEAESAQERIETFQ